MAGTIDGGKRAAATNKLHHGPDFYKNIGRLGGAKRTDATKLKGFGTNRDLASKYGRVGGKISKRGPKKI